MCMFCVDCCFEYKKKKIQDPNNLMFRPIPHHNPYIVVSRFSGSISAKWVLMPKLVRHQHNMCNVNCLLKYMNHFKSWGLWNAYDVFSQHGRVNPVITQPHPKHLSGHGCVSVCMHIANEEVWSHKPFSQQNSETERVDRISAPCYVGLATPQPCCLILKLYFPQEILRTQSVSFVVRSCSL